MKRKWVNRDKDGTGKVPAGNRAARRLKEKLPLEFFVKALGWVYHHLRLRFGETLRSLAEKSGAGVQTIYEMEAGEHPATMEVETRVAGALGYHADEVHRLTRRWARKLMHRKQPGLRAAASRLAGMLAPWLNDALALLAA